MLRLDQFLNATRALILARAFTQEMPGKSTALMISPEKSSISCYFRKRLSAITRDSNVHVLSSIRKRCLDVVRNWAANVLAGKLHLLAASFEIKIIGFAMRNIEHVTTLHKKPSLRIATINPRRRAKRYANVVSPWSRDESRKVELKISRLQIARSMYPEYIFSCC